MSGLNAIFLAALAVLTLGASPAAAQIETRARQAYMIDAATGTVLLSKEPDARFPPASLAKLVTAEYVFAELDAGRLDPAKPLPVSVYAWRTGGAPSRTSTMFAAVKSEVPVGDLIHGVAVLQANDSCIILAEGIAETEEAFTARLNERAKALGLTGTVLINSSGLPGDGQTTTVRDMVRLAQHLWTAYPQRMPLFSQTHFEWNKINQPNRNPLLKMGIGADGLSLGYDESHGFAIVATATSEGRRTILALAGLSSDKERTEEARRLIEWSRTGFRTVALFADGETIGEAKTFGGDRSRVKLVAKGPVGVLIPSDSKDRLIARIVYDGPVEAPVKVGLPVGRLRVWAGDRLVQETPLYTAEEIGVGTLSQRALDAVEELMFGWFRSKSS